MQLTRWLFLFGLMVAAFTTRAVAQAPTAQVPVSQSPGRIIARAVTGQVTARNNATQVVTAVQNDMVLFEGTTISTAANASVVLVFANGANCKVGTDSVLNIETFIMDPFSGNGVSASTITVEPSRSVTKLNLTRGEVVGKVAKLKHAEGSTFTVGTPVGAAGIRGTTFRIVFRPTGNGQAFFALTTQEGDVQMQIANGAVNTPVDVVDGKEIAVTVSVTTDAAGVTTIAVLAPEGSPPGTPPTILLAVDAPAANLADVSNVVLTTFVQAVADVVLTSPPPLPGTIPPPPTTSSEPPPENQSPPPIVTQPDTTTPGAGLP